MRELREVTGLSQQQVALRLGISQLPDHNKKHRRGGQKGKARQTFEMVSKLPRHEQKKILDVVNAFVAQAKVVQ